MGEEAAAFEFRQASAATGGQEMANGKWQMEDGPDPTLDLQRTTNKN